MFVLAIGAQFALPAAAWGGPTLDRVKAAGALTCGVNRVEADYSKQITHGDLTGLGADVCRAVAAAVLGDAAKLTILAYPDEPRALAALKAGQIHLLVGATPSLANAAVYGIGLGPPIYFDGQGFLVPRGSGIVSLDHLAGKQICYIAGTAAEDTLIREMAKRKIAYKPFPFEERGEMEAALVTGHCAAITGDVSDLANMRAAFHARSAGFAILGETISQEPLAPAYRLDDAEWPAVVTWTVEALVQAEQRGVTQADIG